jgi:hypothetical protein
MSERLRAGADQAAAMAIRSACFILSSLMLARYSTRRCTCEPVPVPKTLGRLNLCDRITDLSVRLDGREKSGHGVVWMISTS